MSNFHGAPYYGAPYGYNGHVPIPPPVQEGMPYGNITQPGYPQYRNPMSMQQPQHVHSAQLSNPYAYNTNSQYSSMGAPGGAVPPAPPPPFQYPGYGQYPPSGPPPTSFPPISFQNHHLPPQRIAASMPLPASPQVFQASTSLPPKPLPSVGLSVGAANNPPLNSTSFTVAEANRESGEQGVQGTHKPVNGINLAASTTQQQDSMNDNSKPAAHQDISLPSDPNMTYYRGGEIFLLLLSFALANVLEQLHTQKPAEWEQ